MKKIIFALMTIVSIIFASCDAPTQMSVSAFSTDRKGIDGVVFTDFFNPVELVYASRSETSTAIVMDKNTRVLYVQKVSGYQWGISPLYDSDGTIMTMEKFLAKHTEKKD